ncbi:MAG: hypothetical protein EOP84_29760, partial [Verrucomicrobiaceae bacterium]
MNATLQQQTTTPRKKKVHSMKKHLIDLTIVAEDIAAATAGITAVRNALTMLKSLDEDERKSLLRLGLRNESFSLGIIELARLHPQAVPAGIDMAAIQRDIVAREQLLPLLIELQTVTKMVEDTLILFGCDIFEGGRALYKTLKVTGGLFGLSEVIAELGRRLPKHPAPAPHPLPRHLLL